MRPLLPRHFHKGEVLRSKLFEMQPPCRFVRIQLLEEIENEVFQVHDSNPRSKWLKRTTLDERLVFSQARVFVRKEKDGNVTSRLIQVPDIPRDLVVLQELRCTTEGFSKRSASRDL